MKVINTFDVNIPRSKYRAALELYAHNAAKYLESEAKRDAPWIDRTSNARNSIQGATGWIQNPAGEMALSIILSGNMEYSVYLELAHEKKWAVLVPTVNKHGYKVIEGYQRLVK